jgi:kynurenine formamidase
MRRILDLSKPISPAIQIYAEPGYADPPYECTEWCSVATQGYRVSALRLGTQTGTHIDAPAHFDAAGATLEALPVEQLVGPYALIDLPAVAGVEAVAALCQAWAGEAILFLRAPLRYTARMPAAALELLLALPTPVWVLSGEIEVSDVPGFAFQRRLAGAGRYLVEDLDRAAASQVRPGGQIAALPLALVGTSGAPCRVVVMQRSPAKTPNTGVI